MTIAIRLPSKLVDEAKVFGNLNMRSIPKQIEYWSMLGKMAEENPDLPLNFIKGVLEGKAEIEHGDVSDFKMRKS